MHTHENCSIRDDFNKILNEEKPENYLTQGFCFHFADYFLKKYGNIFSIRGAFQIHDSVIDEETYSEKNCAHVWLVIGHLALDAKQVSEIDVFSKNIISFHDADNFEETNSSFIEEKIKIKGLNTPEILAINEKIENYFLNAKFDEVRKLIAARANQNGALKI